MLKQARLSSCQNLFGSISGLDPTDLISLEVHQLGIVACDCRSGVGRCGGRQNATLLSVWELRPHHQRHFQRRTSYVVHCQRRQTACSRPFYCAPLHWRGICCRHVSVRPSVCHVPVLH